MKKRKESKYWTVTFGKFRTPTKHRFKQKRRAVSKARKLKKELPEIKFQVRKL